MRQTLTDLKNHCKDKLPLKQLLAVIGHPELAKSSARNIWRDEKHASAGCVTRGGITLFHDFGTGENWDEIEIIGRHFGVFGFRSRLQKYCELAGVPWPVRNEFIPQRRSSAKKIIPAERPQEHRPLPDREGFARGLQTQIEALARRRGIGLPGLRLADERGLLVFGRKFGFECWGLTDQSGRMLELRRLDGGLFPPVGPLQERKSHAVRNSQKAWPLGILEAREFSKIALVEGMPDFLEAHYLTIWEGKADVAPVTMLSASPSISEEALALFAGKHVRIFPHAELHGAKGAVKWAKQLRSAGATVDCFDFAGLRRRDGKAVNDLLEYSNVHPDEITSGRAPLHILP